MSFINTISISRPSGSVEPDKTVIMSYAKRRNISTSVIGRVVEKRVEAFINEPMKLGRGDMLLTEEGSFRLNEDGSQRILEDGL